MSEAHAIQQPEIDDPADDVRKAIEDLKIETPPEARIVVDKSSAQPERARDEQGKFVEKPKEQKPERKVLTLPEKTPAPANEQTQTAAPMVTPIAPQTPAIKAPDSWKAEIRPKFADLPPDVQAEINRREQDIIRGLSKQDDERLFGRKVSEIVSPYLPVIRAEGGTPERAIQDLLQTAHTLRQGSDFQKAQSIATVMQQFKVPAPLLLSILQGSNVVSGQPQQPGQPINPIIESLEQRLNRMEQERQEEIQQRKVQEQAALTSQIEEFAAKPGHEHFEKVKPLMGHLLESEQAQDLDEAYEKAIWADPEIRNSLIAARTQQDQSQRINEQQARTSRAKQAAVSVVGGPGGAKLNGSSHPSSSIEDDLRAAIRDHSGRV